jgi:5-methylcytosine-specific restriction endonuclease McrA
MVSRLSQDPSWIYNNKIGAMRRALDPDWILHSAQAALKRSEDPIWYENVLKIRNGQGIWYGHPVVSTTRLERIKQYYKTPIGRESQIRTNHKRRATEAKLKTKEQDSFWKMTPQRIERIIKRQNGMCPMCGDPLGEHYHRDHIIPLHLEGRNGNPNPWCPGLVRGNVQILHKGCNSKKHNSWNISRAINEMLVDIV